MPFARAGQLARFTPSARVDDPIGLVAENLRESNYGTLPVLDRVVLEDPSLPPLTPEEREARVVGIIDERDLAQAVLPVLEKQEMARRESWMYESAMAATRDQSTLAGPPASDWMNQPLPGHQMSGQQNGHAPSQNNQDITQITARQIMRHDIGIVPASFSLHNTLLTLERYNAAALPVIDDSGFYRGMISRADVIAALGQQVRPPVVGGMATPLGVWLTTGSLTGGVPALGLFLSGMVLSACQAFSDIVLLFGLSFANGDWAKMFASGRLGVNSDAGGWLNLVVTFLQALIFLLALRALPMSGIHAAEHQTVWAIEKGLPLTPENVGKMPRAHPRCGTNLMALMGLILIIFAHLPDFDPMSIVLALLFVFLTWRRFGSALQEYLTTRPASRKQLESGIRAGEEILRKYQEQPHVPHSFGMRLFNSGLVLSVVGFMLVQALYLWAKSGLVNAVLQ
jgi:CBS domain-containing protein